MITTNNKTLIINGVNKATSQRATQFYNHIIKRIDEEIKELLDKNIINSYEENTKFLLTKNAIRNYVLFSYMEKYADKINELKEEDKYLDEIHGLAIAIGKGEEYMAILSEHMGEEKISFTTKRNCFIALL